MEQRAVEFLGTHELCSRWEVYRVGDRPVEGSAAAVVLDRRRVGHSGDDRFAGFDRLYLQGTGQSAEVPTLAPARAPPQAELEFEYRDC